MALVNIIPVKYTDSYGNDFQMGVDAALYNQEDGDDVSILGGPIPATGVAALQALPASVKPRRVYMKNPAGKGRYVPALTASAGITDPGATLSIEDSNNVATTFTKVGDTIGEYFGKHYTP